jgi:hypothetical protein
MRKLSCHILTIFLNAKINRGQSSWSLEMCFWWVPGFLDKIRKPSHCGGWEWALGTWELALLEREENPGIIMVIGVGCVYHFMLKHVTIIRSKQTGYIKPHKNKQQCGSWVLN